MKMKNDYILKIAEAASERFEKAKSEIIEEMLSEINEYEKAMDEVKAKNGDAIHTEESDSSAKPFKIVIKGNEAAFGITVHCGSDMGADELLVFLQQTYLGMFHKYVNESGVQISLEKIKELWVDAYDHFLITLFAQCVEDIVSGDVKLDCKKLNGAIRKMEKRMNYDKEERK